MRSFAKIIAAFSIVLFSASLAQSGDLGEIRMKVFQQILENKELRILEINLAPGETVNVNSHPDHQAYAASDGTLTITSPNGKTATVTVKAGDALWQMATNYVTVNSGRSDFKAVILEPK